MWCDGVLAGITAETRLALTPGKAGAPVLGCGP